MKKIVSIILILSTLMLAIAACSDPVDGPDDTKNSPSGTSDGQGDNSGKSGDDVLEIPKETFGGEDFVILTADIVAFNYALADFEEPSDDAYENAFYQRNLTVEEMLDINISQVAYEMGSPIYNQMKTAVDAGTGDYGCVFNNMTFSSSATGSGYCLPFDEFDYIDLDKTWWNRDCTDQMALAGGHYMIAGDIALSDKECLWTICFIKDYITQYGLENPYTLVAENRWTWDKLKEMYSVAALDMNSDGKMDQNDMWGLTTHPENFAASWEAAGLKLAETNDEGIPEITWNTEQFVNVFEEIVEIMGDTDRVSTDVYFITTSMREAKTLFATDVIALVREYRSHEYDFGILPYPKYNSDVERYNTYVAVNSHVLTVGLDCEEPYKTSIILETMAAKGHDILMPVYYDGQLKTRYSRDEESSAMLDIIFKYRCYDLGVFFDWGYTELTKPGANPAVLFAELEKSMNKKIDKALKKLTE